MRRDPQMLLSGAGKLIGITLIAALAGAGIGIGIAELTDDDDNATAVATATSTVAAPVVTQPPPTATQPVPDVTQTTATQTTATQTQTTPTATTPTGGAPVRNFMVPRVQVLSAEIAPLSADGGTRVTVRVRVTNRRGRALKPEDPVLLEGPDSVPLADKAAAGAVRKALEPGETAAGSLQFSVPSAVAQRIRATRKAKLKIATRTINLMIRAA